MDEEQFRAWNEHMSESFSPEDYHHSANPIVRWIEGARVRRLLRRLNAGPLDRVLEVGVGMGHILAQIHSERRSGIDLSKHYLKSARELLGPDVELTEGNAENLSAHFAAESFDRVYCSEVIEHVQHPEAVVRGMAALLEPGGIIVISVPNDQLINRLKAVLRGLGVYKLLFRGIADAADNEWHLHVFTRADLRRLCAETGLTVTALDGVPWPFLPLRYVLAARKTA